VPITVQQALSAVAERRALKSKLVDGQTEVAEMRITEAQQQIQASPDAGSESEHDSDGEKLAGQQVRHPLLRAINCPQTVASKYLKLPKSQGKISWATWLLVVV
jgi:hypothetical protein